MQDFSQTINLNELINKKVQNILNEKIKQIEQQIKKEIPNKMALVRTELFGSFTTIVNQTFIEIFNQNYGPNYNINSLLNSISFNNGNGIIPNFSYNEDLFQFNQELLQPDLNNRYNKFNKNAGLTDEFVRFNDPRLGRNTARYRDEKLQKELEKQYREAQKTIEDYDSGNLNLSVEELNETLDYIEYLDNTRGKLAKNIDRLENYTGLNNVYKIASEKAYERFNIELNTQLKPRFLQKYGITI